MKIRNLTERLGEVISSANILPLVLLYLILAISFVLFRMKNVEMDYRIHDISKDIQKSINDGKDVKARKAIRVMNW